jgi:hypothetical protein
MKVMEGDYRPDFGFFSAYEGCRADIGAAFPRGAGYFCGFKEGCGSAVANFVTAGDEISIDLGSCMTQSVDQPGNGTARSNKY